MQDNWVYEAFEDESTDEDEMNYENIEQYIILEDLLNFSDNENSSAVLKEALKEDINNEVINIPVVVTRAEMFLAVLKFSMVNSLPVVGLTNLFKMINSFFGSPVLPDTRYHINKLFNCKNTVEYHSICSNCKRYIKKFSESDRAVRCKICNTTILLKSPTYTGFFSIINVNNEITNLIMRMQNIEDDVCTRDFVNGSLYHKFINSLPDDDKLNCLTSTFNTVGSPLFESSNFSIWSIQFILNEMPYNKRTAKSLVCGIWFGRDKTDMNIFLRPFVEYMNELSTIGIKCIINNEQRDIKIFTLCCCVNSVARASMQGIHQFNGHYGCSWCLHPGLYVRYTTKGGNMKYILLDDKVSMRTERDTISHMQQSLTSRNHVYGVKNPTVLLLLNKFNVVSGFVPDI